MTTQLELCNEQIPMAYRGMLYLLTYLLRAGESILRR